jgi:hypothetical protein
VDVATFVSNQLTFTADAVLGGGVVDPLPQRRGCIYVQIWRADRRELLEGEMALHELATNATKHGALSAPHGRTRVSWAVDRAAEVLRLRWTEAGGPTLAGAPAHRGFGSRRSSRPLSAASSAERCARLGSARA